MLIEQRLGMCVAVEVRHRLAAFVSVCCLAHRLHARDEQLDPETGKEQVVGILTARDILRAMYHHKGVGDR